MNKFRWILLFGAALLLVAGYAFADCGKKPCPMKDGASKPCCAKAEGKPCCLKAEGTAAATGEAAVTERTDVLYACDCGGDCGCNTLSKTPGQCACGKELRWHHVVRVEGDVALLCGCEEGCKCEVSKDDPEKCGCGKPLKRVSLKDSGLFFCNCGGSCGCNNVSDKPGECRCGMQLKPA